MNTNIISLLEGQHVLSREEEEMVFRYYKDHPSMELRNLIIEKNMGLCRTIARKYSALGVEYEELEQEGVFGLIEAVERFDVDKGYKFSTYAHQWVRQAITRYIMNSGKSIRIPVHMAEKLSRIQAIIREYQKEYNETPTSDYLASKMGLDEKVIENMLIMSTQMNTSSLNAKIANDDSDGTNEVGDFIASNENMSDQVEKDYDFDVLLEKIKERLDKKSYDILCLRFGLLGTQPMTLEEVGNIYGVTRERIRQIEAKSLRKIKNSHHIKQLLLTMYNH